MSTDREAIFESCSRTDASPARYSESTFTFLNRVSGPYWKHTRQLIQSWADQLPAGEPYNDITGRLRKDEHQFRSAFLELYLHRLFSQMGATITVHPDLPGTSRHLDYEVEIDGWSFYLEAHMPGPTQAQQAATNRLHTLFDTVDRLSTPRHVLMLLEVTQGPRPPAGARLRKYLSQWLRELEKQEAPSTGRESNWPTCTWSEDGWVVTFAAVPTKNESASHSDQTNRAIGVLAHHEAGIVNDAKIILEALAEKDRAYGDLGKPYVIAVGLYIFDSDHWQALNAFYGPQRVMLQGDDTAVSFRGLDGYFAGPPHWQHRNVSGVLLVNQLQPNDPTRADVTWWPHPAPDQEPPEAFQVFAETVRLQANDVVHAPPQDDVRRLLGLPEPWPPDDPWPRH